MGTRVRGFIEGGGYWIWKDRGVDMVWLEPAREESR
jgi:hypothetical protein